MYISVYSVEKMKTWRTELEDLQPFCNKKYKWYQEDILYSFVLPKEPLRACLEDIFISFQYLLQNLRTMPHFVVAHSSGTLIYWCSI